MTQKLNRLFARQFSIKFFVVARTRSTVIVSEFDDIVELRRRDFENFGKWRNTFDAMNRLGWNVKDIAGIQNLGAQFFGIESESETDFAGEKKLRFFFLLVKLERESRAFFDFENLAGIMRGRSEPDFPPPGLQFNFWLHGEILAKIAW